MKPRVFDLFCGLGGWSEGFREEGYSVVGFDIEQHEYAAPHGTSRTKIERYPGQLVLQDVRTIHGKQFRNASCIVASPPCQEFSYMAMPFSRGKQIAAALRGDIGEADGIPVPFPEGYTGSRTVKELTALFDACFRIQREACEAARRYIPMVVENVNGAQPWVGRANAHYGSQYLWGDVGMVGGRVTAGMATFGNVLRCAPPKKQPTDGSWFYENYHDSARRWSSKSKERKAWTAQISKVPIELARYIARCYYPSGGTHEIRGNNTRMATKNVGGFGR